MENQFTRVGQLIYDLEANAIIDTTGFKEFLGEEFHRMTIQLGSFWLNNEPGLPYLLEFHKVECERLLNKAKIIYEMFIHVTLFREGKEFMKDLFILLITSLNEQRDRIEKMIDEPASSALADIC